MQAEDVDWVKKNMAANTTYKDDIPNKLNVAIRGDITLEFIDPIRKTSEIYYCPKMIVALGSTNIPTPFLGVPMHVNNIWIFSNSQNSKYSPNKTIFNVMIVPISYKKWHFIVIVDLKRVLMMESQYL